MKFVGADSEESKKDFTDPFIKRLQESIRHIKRDREMETRYMFLYELTLKEERKLGHAEGKAEGKAEVVLSFLKEHGEIPAELKKRIQQETNLETLSNWVKLAACTQSVEAFVEKM